MSPLTLDENPVIWVDRKISSLIYKRTEMSHVSHTLICLQFKKTEKVVLIELEEDHVCPLNILSGENLFLRQETIS